jgi:hypothetical protein
MTTPEIILLLTPIISLGVTAVLRVLLPKIPGPLLPVIAGAVGVFPDAINAFASGSEASPLKGFLAGCAAVALHQVKVQLGKPKREEGLDLP